MASDTTGRDLHGQVRLRVYQAFVERGRAPSPVELAGGRGLPPLAVEASLRRLGSEEGALVLLPDGPYVWMAEPFSGVPTSFRVEAEERVWYGNCIWDALAILALVGVDGRMHTACPDGGEALQVTVTGQRLDATGGVRTWRRPPGTGGEASA